MEEKKKRGRPKKVPVPEEQKTPKVGRPEVTKSREEVEQAKKIIRAIWKKIDDDPKEPEPYEDMFQMCRNVIDGDFDLAMDTADEVRRESAKMVRECDPKDSETFYELYKKCLLFRAPYFFDDYLLFMETERQPDMRFYQPRRKVLKPVVDALQKLADDELDELFLSMPPRVGKTTVMEFFMSWMMGRDPEKSNLYSAYSDTITTALYNGMLELLTDNVTYQYEKVFPGEPIRKKNAAEETIDLVRAKKYPSLTCRSLYGTLNGACDCNGVLVADDLIGGIEEALNPDRMVAAWTKVDNNLLSRAKENAKILWIGTRWSVIDPIGVRLSLLQNERTFRKVRYQVIELPALNEDDKTNFLYDHGVGFSTAYYHRKRASFERNNDTESWLAQYMQQPVEREGTVFQTKDLRYYDGTLPDEVPDRVLMAVDPAYGGGDYVAGPVAFQYGEDFYIVDVVYSNEDKKFTQPAIVRKIEKYEVDACQIECTKATEGFMEDIRKILDEDGYRCNLTGQAAPGRDGKETRIFDKAPDIREHFIFLESGKRNKEYDQFMQNVYSFKILGKNKHDDAPDSLAQLVDMALLKKRRLVAFQRTF